VHVTERPLDITPVAPAPKGRKAKAAVEAEAPDKPAKKRAAAPKKGSKDSSKEEGKRKKE
jgi:hypothetical protein